jgi:putative transposase
MPRADQHNREWGAGRMAFLAKREAIRADLAAGRSLIAVHAMHSQGQC